MVDDITTSCAEVASFGKTFRIHRPKNCDKIAKLRKCRIMKALKAYYFIRELNTFKYLLHITQCAKSLILRDKWGVKTFISSMQS